VRHAQDVQVDGNGTHVIRRGARKIELTSTPFSRQFCQLNTNYQIGPMYCNTPIIQDTISHGATMEVKQLRDKLRAAEQLCEEYMDDNEQLKRDIRELQTEIDESQDQYREEEIDEFRDLQRELEQVIFNLKKKSFYKFFPCFPDGQKLSRPTV
jgi:hypothetical protein